MPSNLSHYCAQPQLRLDIAELRASLQAPRAPPSHRSVSRFACHKELLREILCSQKHILPSSLPLSHFCNSFLANSTH